MAVRAIMGWRLRHRHLVGIPHAVLSHQCAVLADGVLDPQPTGGAEIAHMASLPKDYERVQIGTEVIPDPPQEKPFEPVPVAPPLPPPPAPPEPAPKPAARGARRS